MLTRVLLHVVAATAPIDVTAHRSSGQERLRRGVPNLSLLVLLYREDGSFEQSAARRGSRKHAGVVLWAAAGGVKSATVQGDLPQRPPLAPGNLANVGNMRLEGGQRWVSVVEPVRHAARYSIREHRVPPDFLWSWLAWVLHAASLNESRTRGRVQRSVQEIRVPQPALQGEIHVVT